MNMQQKLAAGIAQLGLNLEEQVQQNMLDYLALLEKWNKVHNLTAVRDLEQMVTLHLLDSLTLLPFLSLATTIRAGNTESLRLLDVGSGAGLPGIVLAMTQPELLVTTMDSSRKKAGFMRQAKVQFGLSNLEVVCGRVEDYHPTQKFDFIVSRAFAEIAEFLRLTRHLLADGGTWLAMKGVYPHDELALAKDVVAEVIELKVPGLEARRHLICMKAAP